MSERNDRPDILVERPPGFSNSNRKIKYSNGATPYVLLVFNSDHTTRSSTRYLSMVGSDIQINKYPTCFAIFCHFCCVHASVAIG